MIIHMIVNLIFLAVVLAVADIIKDKLVALVVKIKAML